MKIHIIVSHMEGFGTEVKIFRHHHEAERHKSKRVWCDSVSITKHEIKAPPCEECKKHVDKSLPPVGDVPKMPKVEPPKGDDVERWSAEHARRVPTVPKEDEPVCVVPRLRKAGECGYEASYECRHVDAGSPTKEDKPLCDKECRGSTETCLHAIVYECRGLCHPTPCPECETKDKEIERLRKALRQVQTYPTLDSWFHTLATEALNNE